MVALEQHGAYETSSKAAKAEQEAGLGQGERAQPLGTRSVQCSQDRHISALLSHGLAVALEAVTAR